MRGPRPRDAAPDPAPEPAGTPARRGSGFLARRLVERGEARSRVIALGGRPIPPCGLAGEGGLATQPRLDADPTRNCARTRTAIPCAARTQLGGSWGSRTFERARRGGRALWAIAVASHFDASCSEHGSQGGGRGAEPAPEECLRRVAQSRSPPRRRASERRRDITARHPTETCDHARARRSTREARRSPGEPSTRRSTDAVACRGGRSRPSRAAPRTDNSRGTRRARAMRLPPRG